MNSRKGAIFFAFVLPFLSLALLAQAQNKPNVSGTWKMNAEKSKLSEAGQKLSIKFDHQGPTLVKRSR